MPIAALLPFFSTIAGGIAALRLRHRLHPFMALASGVLVATAIADLLPEAQGLVGVENALEVAIAALAGYLALTLVEAFIHQANFEHEHLHDPDPPDGSAAPIPDPRPTLLGFCHRRVSSCTARSTAWPSAFRLGGRRRLMFWVDDPWPIVDGVEGLGAVAANGFAAGLGALSVSSESTP